MSLGSEINTHLEKHDITVQYKNTSSFCLGEQRTILCSSSQTKVSCFLNSA